MFTVNGDIFASYAHFVGVSMDTFLPLLAATIGLFLAFAIAEKLRFSIGKMIKK